MPCIFQSSTLNWSLVIVNALNYQFICSVSDLKVEVDVDVGFHENWKRTETSLRKVLKKQKIQNGRKASSNSTK